MSKKLLLVGAMLLALVFMAACAGPQGPQGPEGPAGPAGPEGPAAEVKAADLSCTECHNDTTLISAKVQSWELEKHANGTAMAEEYGNKSCSFCHSGNSFSENVAAGKNFTQVEAAPSEPARQDCRACHQIHTTYTTDDWALETEAPVTLVVSGATFDGGAGNLCANCHQARRYLANFVAKDKDGNVIPDKYQTSVRFNSHLSVQSDIMLGVLDVNSVLGVEGKASPHYSKVEDTCVGCHLGKERNHTFEAKVETCVECHSDAKDVNINGNETTFEEKYAELEAALLAKGIITKAENGTVTVVTKNADGSPVLLDPAPAAALYVYGTLEEDASLGAHNPGYVNALLDAAIAALK